MTSLVRWLYKQVFFYSVVKRSIKILVPPQKLFTKFSTCFLAVGKLDISSSNIHLYTYITEPLFNVWIDMYLQFVFMLYSHLFWPFLWSLLWYLIGFYKTSSNYVTKINSILNYSLSLQSIDSHGIWKPILLGNCVLVLMLIALWHYLLYIILCDWLSYISNVCLI